jgi:uncharacterized repeat protein (TIGR01451 family)
MTAGKHRSAGRRARVSIFGLLLVTAVGPGQATMIALADPPVDPPGPPSADGVQPVVVDTPSSNDDCGLLGFDHGISTAANGTVSSGGLSVTVTGYDSPTGFLDWSSNLPIHGVYVKGGPSGGNLFAYAAGDTGDRDLHRPHRSDGGYHGVSHVAFCWNDAPPAPDVVVEKANHPAGTVSNGTSITYTLRIGNGGTGTAAAAEVTDRLPSGVSFVSATAGCSETSGLVTCPLGDVGADSSVDVEITVRVDTAFCGTITNSAVVSAANEGAEAAGDNTSNEVTNTVDCAEPTPPDLRVTKTSSADGLLQDADDFVYTITVENVGEETATGVEVHDTLPSGLNVLVSPLPSFRGEFCTVASSVVVPGVPMATVDCGPASLDVGASASVKIHVVVNGDVCGRITNVVGVEGVNEPAENVGPDNHAQVSDEIACQPGIRLLKRGPALAHVGDTITYVLTATNTGGVELTDVELADPRCDTPPTVVDDGDGDIVLAVDEVWTFGCDHTITADDGDPIRNEATVSGRHDAGTVSDSDTHEVDLIHPAIHLVKTVSPTAGPAGTPIAYTYAVTNTGDTTLFDISVDDDIEGHIRDIPSLAAGATVEVAHQIILGSSPIANVGTAQGVDVLGLSVSDDDEATVTVVSGVGGEDGDGPGGTPFTGADAGDLTALLALLAGVGTALLLSTRLGRAAPG